MQQSKPTDIKRLLATFVAAAGAMWAIMILAYSIEHFLTAIILTAIGTSAALAIRFIVGWFYPPGALGRRLVQWLVLIAAVVLIAALTFLGFSSIRHWEFGHPGNDITIDFMLDWFVIEYDYSNQPRHMVLHGAPGYWRIRLPFAWLLAAGVLLSYTFWIAAVYRRFPWLLPRAPAGLCQTCGYNLTGNVSGICPECGTRVGESRIVR